MMSVGKVMQEYNDAKRILEQMELQYTEDFHKAQTLTNSLFSSEFKKASITKSYNEMYTVARRQMDYNLLVKKDEAIFQFGYERKNGRINELRYAFFECPIVYPSYGDFLDGINYTTEEVGDAFLSEYEDWKERCRDNLVDEGKTKINPVSIRYDYSEAQYAGIKHPVSHFHIGENNEIRIPTKKIITPFSFVTFVLRNVYYQDWKRLIHTQAFSENYYKGKRNCQDIKNNHFSPDEEKDFYMM
ncbi:DUF2290 domain-containing protein [Listeria booriae]|uniref:DUF2290 domain-containing protein n=1 Tax=Listeria booriae TaxID=1552123 RepID=A0A841ZZ06_9LIST|nr:DUF2290 domain-containing protein [Listeria booriae]MBC1566941.1 DUF2290 domain-containing protein [Listeria booriae]